ncbi:TRAP transporter substrate-binding protein [Flavilitoribacter nigricans]|uniref:C4-dicarboxylate ABC transporter substrate-binding protein n=1 Tax=Flavilitoribacter nigricans (strain ATCC 23147 / DSM 23189 / NBRC 102662 / NCIMB 1420 / SS-2) TaxID=1122177 RepID=A0A2D0NAJ1_FLAN2|nr:TRAP transporter substrate-binding protein [Flavilitoribacter nigricans]PHN05505.1 C4-dicarboxylate ABC transporter substrate-binding protein [Flavilitoribacter nigricans DSM 23189 = NBRC 102662]
MKSLSPLYKTIIVCSLTLVFALSFVAFARYRPDHNTIVLHGASQFDDSHSYTRALVRFSELVASYYTGPEKLEFVLHKNSELGTEKEYFSYMNIGAVVDFAITSPSHGSTFSRMITIMDVPFLFQDTEHYLAAMESDVFADLEQQLYDRADVRILGYGGGEKRHIFGRRPVRNLEELQGFDMRVMGSPIQSRMFSALGAYPTVISGDEVYNAIQTGVISGAENSATALDYFKWYEVAQDVSLTAVSIIVRPLLFSGKRFRALPAGLQDAILKAGREAMQFERELEIAIDDPLMQQLAADGKVRLHEFANRDTLLKLAAPVKAAYAREVGASAILDAINALK